jgi:double-stranded uracil-DNA glycosylase
LTASPRPTAADLASARDRTLEDLIAPDLAILFVGINPGLWSGATGFHFARPGNRFWRAIHEAGLTPRLVAPHDEIRAGGRVLEEKIVRFRPRKVAFLGVSTYRIAFERPKAAVGRQEHLIADSEIWVLPNPSGLNAHYQLPQLVEAYGRLRD